MMAAYRDGRPVLERAAALLTELPETGGIDDLLRMTGRGGFAEAARRMMPRGGSEVIIGRDTEPPSTDSTDRPNGADENR